MFRTYEIEIIHRFSLISNAIIEKRKVNFAFFLYIPYILFEILIRSYQVDS